MALKLDQLEGTISVISKLDSALDCSDDDYKQYIESGLDESFLKFKDGDAPTKFVMRKTLPWGLAKKVEDEKVSMQKGEMQIRMSFIAEEVRVSLIDIINPPHLPESECLKYKKASDGGASEQLVEKLLACGMIQDLYAARQAVLQKNNLNKDGLKKS
jgi:hypothetical protein